MEDDKARDAKEPSRKEQKIQELENFLDRRLSDRQKKMLLEIKSEDGYDFYKNIDVYIDKVKRQRTFDKIHKILRDDTPPDYSEINI